MVLVKGATTGGFGDRMLEFVVQRDLVNDMLLAHELTHALQDQNYALPDSSTSSKTTATGRSRSSRWRRVTRRWPVSPTSPGGWITRSPPR